MKKKRTTIRVQLELTPKTMEELRALKRLNSCVSYAEVIRRLLDGSIKI